jgi:hypothetical protein
MVTVHGNGQRRFRQAEVEQPGAAARDHDVARLQVAVDDAAAVRGRQRRGDLGPVAQHLVGRQRASLKPRRKRLPFEVLHDQEVDAILVADVEQRADMGMGQGGDRTRLPVEAPSPLGIGGILRGKDLDRDVAAEPGIAGAVDLAHSALAERGGDLVRATESRCRVSTSAMWDAFYVGWNVTVPDARSPGLNLAGDPGGTRTHDPRLKRPLLYQLSYQVIGRS